LDGAPIGMFLVGDRDDGLRLLWQVTEGGPAVGRVVREAKVASEPEALDNPAALALLATVTRRPTETPSFAEEIVQQILGRVEDLLRRVGGHREH
jgi:hypothetical protein